MSLTRMASSGKTLSISCAARCGWIGEESSAKPGAMNAFHSRRYPSMVASHFAREAAASPMPSRESTSASTCWRKVRIGHQPERHWIIAGDLVGIDVDVDELGRWNGERIAGKPRAGRAVVDAHAERKQDIGGARGVIGLIGAVACDKP